MYEILNVNLQVVHDSINHALDSNLLPIVYYYTPSANKNVPIMSKNK